jgi:hypothetical protein
MLMATQMQTVFDDVPAWPSQPGANPNPNTGIGGNKPPLEEVIPLEFREVLLRERPDFLQRMEDLIGAADRAIAVDDVTLGKCGDLVRGLRACDQHITATHKEVKEPHLKAGRLVDAEKNGLIERVAEAKAKVEKIGNAYQAKKDAEAQAERDRIAAVQRAAAEAAAKAEREREAAEAEAARLAALATSDAEREAAAAIAAEAAARAEEIQAAAALAPAAPARAEPVRSDTGATVSGKQEWKSEVTDYTVAFMAVEDNPKVREAIDKAVAGLVRAGKRQIEGVRIWPVAKANFR